ncbi:MAG: membrane integrity-associated transporter subunit PqiC [Clostridia bacterium]|nr:membrane integrity-associated transporter subunit PqiC [Deltaproteobacteria bacterium]
MLPLLVACGRSAPMRLYALAESPSSSRAGYSGAPLRVEAVNLPPEADDIRMLRHTGAYELGGRENERWTAPLPYLIRQTLARDLAARLPDGVTVYPDAPRPAGTVSVVVHVLTLEEAANKLTMRASWTIHGTGTEGFLVRGEKTLSASVDGSGESTSAALSKVSAELADAIVGGAVLLPAASASAATGRPAAR